MDENEPVCETLRGADHHGNGCCPVLITMATVNYLLSV